MTETESEKRKLLKEQGLTDEEIEKKLCTPTGKIEDDKFRKKKSKNK